MQDFDSVILRMIVTITLDDGLSFRRTIYRLQLRLASTEILSTPPNE